MIRTYPGGHTSPAPRLLSGASEGEDSVAKRAIPTDSFRQRKAYYYLIGRLMLDGAEPGGFAARFNVGVEVIEGVGG